MVKIKVDYDQLQLGAPVRVPGQYYIRATARGPVVSKWPRKRGKNKTPAQVYKEVEFGLASSWASNPDPMLLESAIKQAEGVPMVPRDFLTAQAYGTLMDLFFEDGTQWTRYRDVTINAQLVLDQVTDEVGSLLYRSPVGWIGIAPGSNGQYLTVASNAPQWATVGAPGAPVPLLSAPSNMQLGNAGNVPVNSTTGSFHQLRAGTVVTGIMIDVQTAAPTCKVQPAIWEVDVGLPNPQVALGPQVTGLVKGWNLLPLSTAWLVTKSTHYAVGLQTQIIGFAQTAQAPAFASWIAVNASPPANPLVITVIASDNAKAHCYLY